MTTRLYSFVGVSYVLLSAFGGAVVVATTLTPADVVPALILCWALFVLYLSGVVKEQRARASRSSGVLLILDRAGGTRTPIWATEIGLLGLSLISWGSALIAVQLSVGLGPAGVWSSYRSGTSVYAEYQNYLSRAQFTQLQGLIYVLLTTVVQLAWMGGALSVVLLKLRMSPLRTVALVLLAISAMYPAIARGTTFEVFKVGVFVTFVLWVRARRRRPSMRSMLVQVAICLGMLQAFLFNVSSRGVRPVGCMSSDVCMTPSLVSGGRALGEISWFPWIYGYFGHGLYYTSVLIDQVVLSSGSELVRSLIPAGAFGLGSESYRTRMGRLVDMGAMWHPDGALFVSLFGFPVLGVVCYLFGRLFVTLLLSDSVMGGIGAFLIVLQLLSFPVGNFVIVSPENQLIVIVIGAWYLRHRLHEGKLASGGPTRRSTGSVPRAREKSGSMSGMGHD